MIQKIRRFFITVGLLLPFCNGWAQAGRLLPEKPAWGDTLRVGYDAGHQQARLGSGQPIFAKLTWWMQDGSYQWRILRLRPDGIVDKSLVVPQHTASLSVRFYTLSKDDEPAAVKRYVYDKKNAVPVAGAYWEDFFTAPLQPTFEKESKQHPRHYLSYAKYFNVVSMRLGPDDSRKAIDSLLPVLEAANANTQSPAAGLLAALCVGYAKSGRMPKAKPYLLQLFSQYPAAAESDLALSLYNYEYYKSAGKAVEDDILQHLKAIFQQYPDGALAGNPNVTYYLNKEKDIPTSAFEKALLPRYADGSLAYYGMDKLPEIYIDRKEQPDSARAILLRVIELWQSGKINHRYRLSASHYNMYVPYCLLLLAKADYQLAQYGDAALHASAGIALVTGSNYEGNLLPDLLSLRADAYRAGGNANLALEDYKQLYKTGQAIYADAIRKLFPLCATGEQDANALLSTLQQKQADDAKAGRETAPAFTGRDLQGKPVRLSDLRGKLVVINFWSIGCGPCIGEMPELNKLVEQYKQQPDVVFLAITGDEREKLLQFFKKRSFLYRVVHETSNTQPFGIESLPVHIVVGRQGEILDRSTGARKDIAVYLDSVIRRNL